MKKLILVRHAKSDWGNPLQKDFDRTLNQRGLRDAPMMGKRLFDKGIIPDKIISSSATRAALTAQLIANNLQLTESKLIFREVLYHASPLVIEQVIQNVDDAINSLMIVCHNPGITQFVNGLDKPITANIPTCGIAVFNLETDNWQVFPNCICKIELFDFPKNS